MKIERLRPAFKDYLWGGTRLRDLYGKESDLDPLAESWELSTHPAGESVISGGAFDGLPLSAYFERTGEKALGSHRARFDRFPVLIKFIDAKSALSVQVHPNNEYALRVEGELGKTEMWYVLDAEPGAFLYFGVERPVTREEFAAAVAENRVEALLHREAVRPGDVFFIEAGTLHAIGAGILICEIQQNSNCTYRVYDYGRLGADGKPRELHIEKALDVARLTPTPPMPACGETVTFPGGSLRPLADCDSFHVRLLTLNGEARLTVDESSFLSVIVTRGEGRLAGPENTVDFRAGESLFVPAGSGDIAVQGDCTLVLTQI